MKAFISVDLEGLPYVVIPGHLSLKGTLYEEARKIATKITLIVANELHEKGFEKVIIADSHGPAVNLFIDELPDFVEIVRGGPRPVSMVTGVEGCDAAIFLGYHAKFGTEKSTFDHTYSGGTIHQLEVNGIPVSEYLLNAYAAGEYDVPVILVAGDAQLLEDDVEKYTPWTEKVTLKKSYSRAAAKSPAFGVINKNLQEATKRAVSNLHEKKVEAFKAGKNVEMRITFRTSLFADIAELLPIVKRTDGLTVEYSASSIIEGYKIFQLLVTAAGGINAYMQYLQ
ncbi:MAG: peptide transporter [Asgard group archaeon]|nr:peptide transporter [Asgard group archaeon]